MSSNVFLLLGGSELKLLTDEEKLQMGINKDQSLNLNLVSIQQDKNRFKILPLADKFQLVADLVLRKVGVYGK